jgi:hypothetical protein
MYLHVETLDIFPRLIVNKVMNYTYVLFQNCVLLFSQLQFYLHYIINFFSRKYMYMKSKRKDDKLHEVLLVQE